MSLSAALAADVGSTISGLGARFAAGSGGGGGPTTIKVLSFFGTGARGLVGTGTLIAMELDAEIRGSLLAEARGAGDWLLAAVGRGSFFSRGEAARGNLDDASFV